jgi:2-oxoisovalerate dehydrogenase E2 component (dihydrolipoyl transacylase)
VAEVMTDKATVELPTPVSGTIEWLGAEPGDLVAVGADLLRLAVDGPVGPSATAGAASTGAAAPVPAAADPFAVGTTSPAAAVNDSVVNDGSVNDGSANGQGAPGTALEAVGAVPPLFPPEHGSTAAASAIRPAERALAAPAVRRRAGQLGFDLGEVVGSGPDGRVLHADLDELLVARDGAPGTAAGTTARAAGDTVRGGREADQVERVKLTGLRRSIARHMEQSSSHIPHFTYVEEVDVTELQQLRLALGHEQAARDDTGERPGVLTFLMRAVVLALRDHPEMNARFDDEAGIVERHRAVHLGIAVQTDQGLVVTVVHHAEALEVQACAAAVARLSQAARAGTATHEELSGSTITISSLGALGGIVSTPIINHPEVAIVGVNKIAERPVVRDGAVVVRQLMNLSCSFDHRVVDGWDGARFVQRIRTLLETPALLFAL